MPQTQRIRNPQQAHARARQIFARMLDGQSLADIARAEGLTVRRVQQIVAEEAARRENNPADDYALLQIARLERALNLLGAEIEAGKVAAVGPFVRVIGELNKLGKTKLYMSAGYREPGADAAMRERFERLAATREIVEERRTPSAKLNEAQVLDIVETDEIPNFAPQ